MHLIPRQAATDPVTGRSGTGKANGKLGDIIVVSTGHTLHQPSSDCSSDRSAVAETNRHAVGKLIGRGRHVLSFPTPQRSTVDPFRRASQPTMSINFMPHPKRHATTLCKQRIDKVFM